MTTPSAELMITPEVSLSALQEMQRDFNKAFKKIADDAEKQVEKGVTNGVKDGARKSRGAFRRMGGAIGGGIKSGFDSLGGARGLATSALGLGLVSYLDRIDKADQGQALLASLFEGNSAQQQKAVAGAAGLSLAEFSQFSQTLRQGGFTEQQDINDVIFDLNERVGLAANGEETILKEFVGLQGQELLNSFLASISQQSGQQQTKYLADLGFGGEVGGNLLSVIDNAQNAVLTEQGKELTEENRNQLSGREVLTALNEANKSEGERLAAQLQKEADLTKEFRDRELEFQNEQRQKLFNQIDDGKLDTFFSERERETKTQEKLLLNFEENMKTAQTAREGIKAAMSALNETVKVIEEGITKLVDLAQKDPIDQATEAASTYVKGLVAPEKDYTKKAHNARTLNRG